MQILHIYDTNTTRIASWIFWPVFNGIYTKNDKPKDVDLSKYSLAPWLWPKVTDLGHREKGLENTKEKLSCPPTIIVKAAYTTHATQNYLHKWLAWGA